MEIRKLENPWSDDLEALVQALPMCWSVEDEMHIKPVDIVRNNDFENPEIGVTHMKDLFLDVTHWRYTRPIDSVRLRISRVAGLLGVAPSEVAAPYRPGNATAGGSNGKN